MAVGAKMYKARIQNLEAMDLKHQWPLISAEKVQL
jgi:hypothetical protein